MGVGKLVSSSSDPDKCGSGSVFFLGEICDEKRNGFCLHLMVMFFWSSVKSIDAAFWVFHGFSRAVCV